MNSSTCFNTQYGANFSPVDPDTVTYFFLTDPFIDKDRDGRVTGRFGAGLLETIAIMLGISGDPDDFNAWVTGNTIAPGDGDAPATQRRATSNPPAHTWLARITPEMSQRFVAQYQKYTGKRLTGLSRAQRIEEFRRLFGVERLGRQKRVR
jgi:hypothetical protein